MDFRFYVWSFQLNSAKSLTRAGCAFGGAADAGPCSAISGSLTCYIRLWALLKQKISGLISVYDSTAAVKCVIFNKDLAVWVSYDTRRHLIGKEGLGQQRGYKRLDDLGL